MGGGACTPEAMLAGSNPLPLAQRILGLAQISLLEKDGGGKNFFPMYALWPLGQKRNRRGDNTCCILLVVGQ